MIQAPRCAGVPRAAEQGRGCPDKPPTASLDGLTIAKCHRAFVGSRPLLHFSHDRREGDSDQQAFR